jgi:hypothetical protein
VASNTKPQQFGYSAQTHPAFEQPANANVAIWRYTDLAKLISVLETRSLHFARADTLGDPFEGYSDMPTGEWGKDRNKRRAIIGQALPTIRRRLSMAVSCWHMNEHESDAMWKLYLSSSEGVCIQSTYSRLIECLPRGSEPESYDILVGQVAYDSAPAFNYEDTLSPFMRKRPSFKHEQEIRALICCPDTGVMSDFFEGLSAKSLNFSLHVDAGLPDDTRDARRHQVMWRLTQLASKIRHGAGFLSAGYPCR